jgi:hypothetical protein
MKRNNEIEGQLFFGEDWERALLDECKGCRVTYFIKQVDKVIEIPEYLMIREFYK